MKRYTWLVAPLLIVLYCCNAEKKVLNSEEKTANVAAAWMKKQHFKTDTVTRFIPGDTVTALQIAVDTTIVHDTIANTIEKMVTRTRTITNTIHDTITVKITNNDLLNGCRDLLAGKSTALDDQVIKTKSMQLAADKWKFKFWLLVSILALLVALIVGIKLFKPTLL